MPTTPFLNMFGRSPIQPLEGHMAKVHACVKLLEPFFLAALKQDESQAKKLQEQIFGLEIEADKMKRDLRLQLRRDLFMPVSRSDILQLLNVQENLACRAKEIASMVLDRNMVLPPTLVSPFIILLKRCIEASKLANEAIHELDELLETSFSGNEIKLVEKMLARLSLIERDTDEKQKSLRQLLFKVETNLPPVHVMFLYKMIDWTGDLANCAQDIGDRLQILIVR